METRTAVELLIQEGYLPSPDLFHDDSFNASHFLISLRQKVVSKDKPVVVHKDFFTLLTRNKPLDLNWMEFEKSRAVFEKGKNPHIYQTFLSYIEIPKSFTSSTPLITIHTSAPLAVEQVVVQAPKPILDFPASVQILTTISHDGKKREVKDFVAHYKHRYEFMKGLLQQRMELQDVVSISRALKRDPMQEVSVIGMVYDRDYTANGNLIYTLEDATGSLKILINKNNQKLFEQGEKICPDEIIGIKGKIKNKMIFSDQVLFPDVPQPTGALKYTQEEVYAAFISDIHFGSKKFLQEEFMRFISWLNGEIGTEKQRDLALKVRYLFVIGDVVAGVGVYPGQEKDLTLLDIKEQYKFGASLFGRFRKDLQIIMCPGNHDSVRAAEPQPPLEKEYAEPLCQLPNLHLVSNPCFVNIHHSKEFEGFNILMYHGGSFHYYIDNVPALRINRARDNPGQVLRLLLQKRHLAPAHHASVYLPTTDVDNLIIHKVPDILVSGDMHRSDISDYNGVKVINCSCWESKTDFQEKTGNNPDFCKVPLYSLKTREVTMLDFSKPLGD